jgi:hypothetical protein
MLYFETTVLYLVSVHKVTDFVDRHYLKAKWTLDRFFKLPIFSIVSIIPVIEGG